MKLPGNSLGISDAKQFEECPMLFYENMKRHSGVEPAEYTGYSYPLAFGNALHEAAELVVANDGEAYLDDAVEHAWTRWGRHLPAESYEELRDDIKTVIDRSGVADNLELIAVEKDMKVSVFVGESDEKKQMLDEEHVEYFYRFKIDALYRDRNDPGHFIIRDFKTVRRRRSQAEVDEDMQLTAYDFGIREMLGNEVTKVTIWYDQVKFQELFTSREEHDRQMFKGWITARIREILDVPVEAVANTPKLNEYCSWCPLLETCGIIDKINDVHLAQIKALSGRVESAEDLDSYIEKFDTAKNSMKALKEYTERISKFLKNNPGTYAGKSYSTTFVNRIVWDPKTLFEIFGEDAFKMMSPVSKNKIGKKFESAAQELEHTAIIAPGGERLNSKKIE